MVDAIDNFADNLYNSGDGTALRFFTRAVKNNFLSEREGRPIFDTALMVEIVTPGSTESMPQKLVERTFAPEHGLDSDDNRIVERTPDYARFEKQIDAFKKQSGDYVTEGTPINKWGQIDAGTAATMKAAGIHTVEQLAGINDQHLQNLGTGARILREQANAFIQTREFGVPTAKMSAETAQLRERISLLEQQLNEANVLVNKQSNEIQALKNGEPQATPLNPAAADPFAAIGEESHKPNMLTPSSVGEADEIEEDSDSDNGDNLI